VGATERNTRIREAGANARAATRITPPLTIDQAKAVERRWEDLFRVKTRTVKGKDELGSPVKSEVKYRKIDEMTAGQIKVGQQELDAAQTALRQRGYPVADYLTGYTPGWGKNFEVLEELFGPEVAHAFREGRKAGKTDAELIAGGKRQPITAQFFRLW
jgi:hypothetical protein